MLPPVSSKQLLYFRAISTMVVDKIAAETMDSNIITVSQLHWVVVPNAEDSLFMVICIYSAYLYYKTTLADFAIKPIQTEDSKRNPRRTFLDKRAKLDKLNKYVLSEPGYHFIKICLFVLFLLIKDPKAVV